jgi:hypothetical protein
MYESKFWELVIIIMNQESLGSADTEFGLYD